MPEIKPQYGGNWNEKYLVFFAIALVSCLITSNVMTLKFFELAGFQFAGSNLIFPFCLILGDIITEVYGFRKTALIIVAALVGRMFFTLSAVMVTALPPSPEWKLQQEFEAIFGQLPRNFVAGCFSYLAGELSNSFVMSRMKTWTGGRHFAARAMASTVVGEFLSSLVFQCTAYLGAMPLLFLMRVVINGTALKVAIELLILPITAVTCRTLKRLEGVDYFDSAPTPAATET